MQIDRMVSRIAFFALYVGLLWFGRCNAFSQPHLTDRTKLSSVGWSRKLAASSQQVWRRNTLLLSSPADEPDKDVAKETAESKETSEPAPSDDTDSGGVIKTILLAVPLFCKFVIVLAIKFLTDLVVFPMLFLYRMARLTKRRIIKFFSSDGPENIVPNGEVRKPPQ